MAKQLKPGQLCTVGKHVYRCSKRTGNPCLECETNDNGHTCIGLLKCSDIFDLSYPVLVK